MDRSRIPALSSCPRLRAQLAQESGLHPSACSSETPNLAIGVGVVNRSQRVCEKNSPAPPARLASVSARSIGQPELYSIVAGPGSPPPKFSPAGPTGPSADQQFIGSHGPASAAPTTRAFARPQAGGETGSPRSEEKAVARREWRAMPRTLSPLPSVSTSPPANGAEGTRTLDPRLAKPMLSQLSYGPREGTSRIAIGSGSAMALEPPVRDRKWAHEESNFGPRRYQRRALTN